MIVQLAILLLVLPAFLVGSGSSASACDGAGPNTHVGAVTDIDLTQKTLTLKDEETATSIVFLASSDLLRGLRVYDQVAVTYAIEGKQLRATSIKKN